MFQDFESRSSPDACAARLAALRSQLRDQGADGFVVPRADAHQAETVAPRDERLGWLTGFTGSAGSAIVLLDRAALFIDGRYTLQAAAQTDTALFEVVAIHERSTQEWIRTELPGGTRLAYDPWLHGKTEIDKLAAAVKAAKGELVPLSDNPVDLAWDDQPPAPAGAVSVHPADLAGDTAAEKRARLAAVLTEDGLSAAVMTAPESFCWLLNIRGSDLARSPVAQGFAVLLQDGRVRLHMEPDKIDGDVRAHLGEDVIISPIADFTQTLSGLTGRVRLDRGSCPMAVAEILKGTSAQIDWGRDPIMGAKARKTEAERQGMRAAHRRDGAAMARFLAWLDGAAPSGSLTEIDVVQKLEAFRRETGALLDISFDTICGSGPNGAIVHYRVNRETNRTIVPGDLLLVDSGGQYRDGTTDITRTMATGRVEGDAARLFTLVLKGMVAVSRARFPAKATGRELDPLARRALWAAGLDYDHGTGHGVGAYLNVHEGPASLSRRGGDVALEPGMILSNEPGCYRNGQFGIRIENLVLVREPEPVPGGEREMLWLETLTLAPIDRRLVVLDLLEREERAWLDGYHARVLEEIVPLVDAETAAWLTEACAPLG
ncbi:MAG: aminopeptidase P family protein [Pseudomonadota bacterium]